MMATTRPAIVAPAIVAPRVFETLCEGAAIEDEAADEDEFVEEAPGWRKRFSRAT